jgi:hypothetical protein
MDKSLADGGGVKRHEKFRVLNLKIPILGGRTTDPSIPVGGGLPKTKLKRSMLHDNISV